jgi:hypothetical protein
MTTEFEVEDEIDKFHQEFENRSKRIRLLMNFSQLEKSIGSTEMKIGEPKKKFIPKVKAARQKNKPNDKGSVF